MTIAQDLCQSALEMANVYGVGQLCTNTGHLNRVFSVLNRMLDAWSVEAHSVFAWQSITFPLVVNQGQYTIGPTGANITNTRPIDVRTGDGAAYLQDTNLNNYPVKVVPQDIWQLIGNRSINSQVPDTLWYDPQFPNGVINIFPLPSIGYTMVFNAVLQLNQFPSLTSTFSFPPGYQEAMETNLAVAIKPYFPAGGPLRPELLLMAKEGLGRVKRANLREVISNYDQEVVSRGAPTYNIYRDANG